MNGFNDTSKPSVKRTYELAENRSVDLLYDQEQESGSGLGERRTDMDPGWNCEQPPIQAPARWIQSFSVLTADKLFPQVMRHRLYAFDSFLQLPPTSWE